MHIFHNLTKYYYNSNNIYNASEKKFNEAYAILYSITIYISVYKKMRRDEKTLSIN